MKVLAVYGNPPVLVAGFNDSTVFVADYDNTSVLDLVAHFLGIAMHDNVNGAPSSIAAIRVTLSIKDV